MKMKTKSRKGFSLIEFVLAIAAGVIVVLAVGVVIVSGQKFWDEAWKNANLQRDASYAMLLMGQSIKKAAAAVVEDGGTQIAITDSDGVTKRFDWNSEFDTLRCWTGDDQPATVIGDVQNLQFEVDDVNDTVTIGISVQEDDGQTDLVSTVMMRNAGG